MRHDVRRTSYRTLASALIAAALCVAGCKSSQPGASPNPAQNQSSASSPSNPTLNAGDTVAIPGQQASARPNGQSAAPAPPAPVPPPALVAPVETRVVIRTTETLSASHSEVGDGFSGELAEPLVAHGATLFARGTRVAGTVIAARGRGRFKGSGDLGIEVTMIFIPLP